jgi:hypothetical protein
MQQLQTSEYDRLKAHYADVKRRIELAGRKPKPAAEQAKVYYVREYAPAPKPEWKRKPTKFNEHVNAWQAWVIKQSQPRKQFVIDRCVVYGYTYQEIIGTSRKRPLVLARQIIQWELKRAYPDVSLPEIGRMFGGKDHSTITSSLAKINRLIEEGELIFRE